MSTGLLKKLIFTIVLISTTFITACQKEETELITFTIANGIEPETLDPHFMKAFVQQKIYASLFEGLVGISGETGLPQPALAKSWDISDDKKQYTFHLRDAKWSDGREITAQDVVDSWLRALNPETGSAVSYLYLPFIVGAQDYYTNQAGPEAVQIRALDAKTFQMDLLGPFPYTLSLLAGYAFAIVPNHTISQYQKQWTDVTHWVSNGPFVLDEWVPRDHLRIVKNPLYWDSVHVQIDQVDFLPIEQESTALNLFLEDEIDWSVSVPPEQIENLKLNSSFQSFPIFATSYLELNSQESILQDVRIRRALALTIPKDRLVDNVLRSGETAAHGIVPPLEGYPSVEGIAFNIQQAQELLAEAGYPNGENFPPLRYIYNTSSENKKVAEFLQAVWKTTLNIDVNLINLEWGSYLSDRSSKNYDIARALWRPDYVDPNGFLELFVSGVSYNRINFNNPEYDELLQLAGRESNSVTRNLLLSQAERIFIEDEVAVIPLFHNSSKQMINLEKWHDWNPIPYITYHDIKAIHLVSQ